MKDVKELGGCELDGNLWACIVCYAAFVQHCTTAQNTGEYKNLAEIPRMCVCMLDCGLLVLCSITQLYKILVYVNR